MLYEQAARGFKAAPAGGEVPADGPGRATWWLRGGGRGGRGELAKGAW